MTRSSHNLYNIQVEDKPRKPATSAPTGSSTDAGLRRLDKAAQRGDPKAADMLARVLDRDDPTTLSD
jgi:hypothetical protein